MPRLPVGKTIRAMCLRCEGAETARRAYDCCSVSCPLYPAHPFRGKAMPAAVNGNPDQGTAEQMERAHAEVPRRSPRKAMLRRQCMACLAEDEKDCSVTDCPLWPWRPMQPGGMPKHRSRQRAMTPVRRQALVCEGKRAQMGKRIKPVPKGLRSLFGDAETGVSESRKGV